MSAGFDVIIDSNPAQIPLRKDVWFGRKRLQRRPVDLFEKLAPVLAKPSDGSFLVELRQERRKRRVDLCQREEGAVAKPAQKPAFHHQHRLLDLRFIPRPTRPGR
jgi:hypothetical protein